MMTTIFLIACFYGTISHFLYDWLKRPSWLAWLWPVSESVWEHFKLAFWPLCMAFGYLALRLDLGLAAFLCAGFLACLHGALCMFGLFYLYFCGLGVGRSVLWLDIPCYFVVMGSSFAVGLPLLMRGPSPAMAALCGAGLLALTALVAAFSYRPPKLPLFQQIKN